MGTPGRTERRIRKTSPLARRLFLLQRGTWLYTLYAEELAVLPHHRRKLQQHQPHIKPQPLEHRQRLLPTPRLRLQLLPHTHTALLTLGRHQVRGTCHKPLLLDLSEGSTGQVPLGGIPQMAFLLQALHRTLQFLQALSRPLYPC